MKRIRFFMAFATLLAGVLVLTLTPATANAGTPKSVVCSTLDNGNTGCTGSTPNGVDLNTTLTAVINILSLVVGIIAVIMIIISGLKFITANGDAGNVKSARHALTYALVGVVVVALAQALVQFVFRRVVTNK